MSRIALSPGASIHLFHDDKNQRPSALSRFGAAGLVLPVGPLDQVTVAENVIVNSEVLPRRGTVVFGGGFGARVISINTLLPDDLLESFVVPGSTVLAPNDYDDILSKIGQENTICRILIANKGETNNKYAIMVDERVLMQSYTATRMEGSDISVEMEFIKWQEVKVRKVKLAGTTAGPWSDRTGSHRRAGAKPRPRYITMSKFKKGKKFDLKKVASKYYGNANAWRWLANHPKNVEAFGVKGTVKKGNKKVKTKVSIKSPTHKNLTAKTKVYLPDTTEKSKGGKTFWQFIKRYKKK